MKINSIRDILMRHFAPQAHEPTLKSPAHDGDLDEPAVVYDFRNPYVPLPLPALKAAVRAWVGVPHNIPIRDDSALIPCADAAIRAFLKAVSHK